MSAPENFESSDHRSRLPSANAAGIAALTHAAIAQGKPLDLLVNLYAGSMIVSGNVAPPDWMLYVSSEGLNRDAQDDIHKRLRKKSTEEKMAAFEELWSPLRENFEDATTAESLEATADRELTLVDATVLPAIQASTGKAGGHTLPVVRLPLSSIDVWWIIDGETIKGSAGWSGSFGVLFPVN